jgi:hypothetical protein
MDLEAAEEAAEDGVDVGDLRFPRPLRNLRLYNLCRMTDFNQLPVDGGWLAQDPLFVEDFQLIRSIDAEAQSERAKKK